MPTTVAPAHSPWSGGSAFFVGGGALTAGEERVVGSLGLEVGDKVPEGGGVVVVTD